jgi:hypothetical protein
MGRPWSVLDPEGIFAVLPCKLHTRPRRVSTRMKRERMLEAATLEADFDAWCLHFDCHLDYGGHHS